MQEARKLSPRQKEVWDRLDLVFDPELDEPITDVGFVEMVAIAGDEVKVFFRLPTYWCSPNFAFLMAEGIRREVGALPWVNTVVVQLEDHLCAEEMNAAVNEGRTFSEVFAIRSEGGDLDEVKETFDRKAFQRRQESVLAGLRALGWKPAEIATVTLGQMDTLTFDDEEVRKQQQRYRTILVSRGLAKEPHDHAFPDLDGTPLTAETFSARMSVLRGVRINMEFGTAFCRGVKKARYKELVSVDGEPTLVDFMLDRVPPRAAAG